MGQAPSQLHLVYPQDTAEGVAGAEGREEGCWLARTLGAQTSSGGYGPQQPGGTRRKCCHGVSEVAHHSTNLGFRHLAARWRLPVSASPGLAGPPCPLTALLKVTLQAAAGEGVAPACQRQRVQQGIF